MKVSDQIPFTVSYWYMGGLDSWKSQWIHNLQTGSHQTYGISRASSHNCLHRFDPIVVQIRGPDVPSCRSAILYFSQDL